MKLHSHLSPYAYEMDNTKLYNDDIFGDDNIADEKC